MSSVDWKYVLARSSDMLPLAELSTAKGRSVTPALNARESASFTIHVLDERAALVQKITTCLIAYRDGRLVWSGPVWTKSSPLPDGNMQVGCVGWFEFANHWLLKTGTSAPPGMPTTTATTMSYPQGTDQCVVAADLLSRGIADCAQNNALAYIGLGSYPSATQPRTVTYPQLTNIGQTITQLANIEAGFDFRVDPTTRLLNMYYDGVWPQGGPYSVNGRGQIRQNAVFGYRAGPENLAALTPQEDASKVENQVYAVGQFGIGLGYDPSIQQIGLFSAQISISDQVTTDILTAFAQVEATTNAYGLTIYNFDQMPYSTGGSAMQPFVDFDVGDFCGLICDYGSVQISSPGSVFGGAQPVRLFAFTVAVSDDGIEQVTNFQCAYQGQS